MISLGPVFQAECLTTARRKRYYATRFLYGALLLTIVGWTYEETVITTRVSTLALLAAMANAIFTSFISAQVVAVLCVTPAMVAGTIADEKQRKTLHYLLASQLSSLEIVGGKLAARLLQLVILVLVGLPIMSILSLFGGLDPKLVLAAFLGTFTTAYAVAGVSIFVSTVSGRARDAIVIVYGLLAAMLATPLVLPAMIGKSAAVEWITGPILRLDPFQLVRLTNPEPGLALRLIGMSVGHLVLGSMFVMLGVFCLRPAFASGGRVRATGGSAARGRLRFWGRPEVGDNAMLWKELHVTAPNAFLRISGGLIGVFAVIFLGDAMVDYAGASFREMAEFGYGDGGLGRHRARDTMQEFIAIMASAAYFVWMVGIATTAAASISSEREEDTWLSLLGTTLTGREILGAKALGAAWRWRFVGGLAVVLWTIGLLAGSIHPIAYVSTLLLFAAFSLAALALGSYLSLRAKSTSKATVLTIMVLLIWNGGYLMCLFPLAGSLDSLLLVFCTPYIIGTTPARYATIERLLGDYPGVGNLDAYHANVIATVSFLSLLIHVVVGLLLAVAAVSAFDKIADRPSMPPRTAAPAASDEEPEAC